MEDEPQSGGLGLVGSVLSRLGGEPDEDRERQTEAAARDTPATPDGDDGRPLTDGGADDAPIGDSPWAEDDPIVFGDDTDADHGAALLDAVTESDEESAPPFGGDGPGNQTESDSEQAAPGHADSGPEQSDRIDPDRIDELEARIGALESDHVQLDATIAELASATTSLQVDVETVGEDVRQLVALLGGIALAGEQVDREQSGAIGRPEEFEERIESRIESRLDEAVDSAVASAVEGTVEVAVHDAIDEALEAFDGTTISDGADSSDGTEPSGETGEDVADGAADSTSDGDDHDMAADAVPEGIHRGVGDPPAVDPDSDPDVEGNADATADATDVDGTGEAAVSAPAASPAEEPQEPAGEPGAQAEASGEPARELVDPRTEAVGARLRQFREGFVDDPTADLPTGNTADEFRFDKILLPTDGAAAPDLSAGELAKPYLETLPDGYAADAVVLEWLDWLVSAADCQTAAHAVGYYESIEWLTDDVREELLGYLEGLGRIDGDANVQAVDEPPEALDLQDHLRSLQYVTELATGEVGTDGI
ncbi:hypothetical protein GCM10028857_02630 [Salinarchaeum chitinilyticum]